MSDETNLKTEQKLQFTLPVACLVLGIVSIPYSLFLIGGLLAVIGFILGAIHLKKEKNLRSFVIWGMSLSSLGLLASIFFGYFSYLAYHQYKSMKDAYEEEGPSIEEWQGVIAPDISVVTLDGKKIRLHELRGKRVVLDFWATWCGPCVKEIPHFNKLSNEIPQDQLVILGISSESKKAIEKFLKKKNVNYPIVSSDDLPSPYGDVRYLPTTFFIDRKGVIQNIFEGYHNLVSAKFS